jgi:hypothetical protein
LPETGEAMIYAAVMHLMVTRLARQRKTNCAAARSAAGFPTFPAMNLENGKG